MTLFKFIKANNFFPKYAPSVAQYNCKIQGKNWRGNPVTFTAADKKAIRDGIKAMAKEGVK